MLSNVSRGSFSEALIDRCYLDWLDDFNLDEVALPSSMSVSKLWDLLHISELHESTKSDSCLDIWNRRIDNMLIVFPSSSDFLERTLTLRCMAAKANRQPYFSKLCLSTIKYADFQC